MDLDEYKIKKAKDEADYALAEIPELAEYMRGATNSVIDSIRKNLRFEIAFAILFFCFGSYMFIFFSDIFYLRIFTFMLLVFCLGFIYYVAKLLSYINAQYKLDISVKEQLTHYIHILSKFTRLYFQLTMIMIPFILLMAFIAGYLDQSQSVDFAMFFSSPTIWLYFGLAIAWSVMMYFFTGWYVKKLYGNHLNKLKEQLVELQNTK